MDPRPFLLILTIAEFFCFSHGAFVIDVDRKFSGARNLSAFKSHDDGRHRILLSAVDLPLGGNGLPSSYGLYYAKIGLGNPSNDYYVQVDTGSDILWVNCVGCKKCPKKSDFGVKLTLYNPTASSNSSAVNCGDAFCKSTYNGALSNCKSDALCQYSVVYGDGSSTSGYFVKDVVQLRRVTGDFQTSSLIGSVVFGCGGQQGGGLGSSSEALDGIVGFGQANSSVLSQLADSGKLKKVFSHCLDTIKGGGIFVIGESVSAKVNTTPIVPKQSHYNVELKAIEVDGVALSLPQDIFTTGDGRGTIIDSGTTLVYFPDIIYQQLMTMIVGKQIGIVFYVVNSQFQCFKYTGRVDDAFPKVTFRFRGALHLIVHPRDYLFLIEPNVYCFGWQSGGISKDGRELTILGDLVLSNKLVVYDLEEQTIGWTDYDCSSAIRMKTEVSSYNVSSHNLSFAKIPPSGRPLALVFVAIVVFWHLLLS